MDSKERIEIIRSENNEAHPAQTQHSWRGSWNRPLKVNPEGLHPLTVARMTDHNVRGPDKDEKNDDQQPSPMTKAA